MPLKYAKHNAVAAPALSPQYTKVERYRCPPTPPQPLGKVTVGYQRTDSRSGRGSPMMTLTLRAGLSAETEYAVAASITPGLCE